MTFQLDEVPLLSRSTVEREEGLRVDAAKQVELWRDGRVLTVDKYGRTPIRSGGTELVYEDATGAEPPADVVLLGEEKGTGYWAKLVSSPGQQPAMDWRTWQDIGKADGEHWLDLRAAGSFLDATSAGLFTTAVALLSWHRRAKFCANCGAAVDRVKAGWATQCPNCGREEYPRTDPAVICLVHDRDGADGSQVLLARQPVWPKGRYSVLAGFVEAGESLEACVAREICEEVGVDVADIRYLGSQPWPFPRSLMLGFAASADASQPTRLADGEIEEAYWVSRDVLREAIAAEREGREFWLGLPGPTSIARRMLESWAAV
ncbi:NAD(+) diphosphatase [Kibdelosporangium phytohabitans]|uniref:NAD(+) diphosphatase n=1 Tax=Kibdelosporangium phytohabitans TaxID=860235 RepID=A0A0N9HXY8_9PSEU|nr:NAD(+) diphosphatase [Kibdelosporangium phytohabitans]ALG06756.1 NADH pyrophosphatase [Kibdelosporangium phytohabitans]MBE1467987.1 NAD+ diphosphatase [Kibdelosporangium phytohabitans]